jgi:hypothetical protein
MKAGLPQKAQRLIDLLRGRFHFLTRSAITNTRSGVYSVQGWIG